MIDINKQSKYWKENAKEDWEVALELVSNNRFRHGLFFAHLALEKIVKALVCKETQKTAPKINNLLQLSELANIDLIINQSDILAEINAFNIKGLYPDPLSIPLTKEETQVYIKNAEKVFAWLMKLSGFRI